MRAREGEAMWPSDPQFTKLLVEAHIDELRRDGARKGRTWFRRRRAGDEDYAGQKPSTVSPSPLGSSIRVETITSSASSGSSFQTPRVTCGGTRTAWPF